MSIELEASQVNICENNLELFATTYTLVRIRSDINPIDVLAKQNRYIYAISQKFYVKSL